MPYRWDVQYFILSSEIEYPTNISLEYVNPYRFSLAIAGDELGVSDFYPLEKPTSVSCDVHTQRGALEVYLDQEGFR